MKKYILFVLLACLTLCGCSENTSVETKDNEEEKIEESIETEGQTGLVWDCVEYNSLEELNEAAGTNIISPAVMGKTNEWFGVISKTLAQYKFDLNGNAWCIRASKNTDQDISGIYDDNYTFTANEDGVFFLSDYYIYRFFYGDCQYVITLTIPENGFEQETFLEVCYEVEFLTRDFESSDEEDQQTEEVNNSDFSVSLTEDGDNIIYGITTFMENGEKQFTRVIYEYEGDKLVAIKNEMTFDSEESAKLAYDELVNGMGSTGNEVLEGNTIYIDNSGQVANHSETRAELYEMLKEVVNQQ